MNFKKIFFLFIIVLATFPALASFILIPMDESQKDHLKAYGVAYWILERDVEVDWLLNYRGGSFMVKNAEAIVDELNIRGVSYERIPDAKSTAILTEIANPEVNMDVVKLQKPPKMAVYSPKGKLPWDDAVTLVLTYAEIPYTVVYDKEVIQGELPQYDWLHLHHEDFTGQYGRFYGSYRNHAWYKEEVRSNEAMATELGFQKFLSLSSPSLNELKSLPLVVDSFLPCVREQILMTSPFQLQMLISVSKCLTVMGLRRTTTTN
jgi:hypothetical protein